MTITNHQMIFKFYSNRAQICLKISCCLQEKEKSIIINMKIEEKNRIELIFLIIFLKLSTRKTKKVVCFFD